MYMKSVWSGWGAGVCVLRICGDFTNINQNLHLNYSVLVIGHYTMIVNNAANVSAFLWVWLKSSFMLVVC